MAMVDRIGPFTFVRLDEPPQHTSAQWEMAARAGVDGVAFWKTGERGEPFTMDSLAVAYTFEEAKTFYPSYLELVKVGAVPVFFGTVEQGQLFKVTKVQLLQCKACVKVVVAKQPTPFGAIVRARWTLVPVDPAVNRP